LACALLLGAVTLATAAAEPAIPALFVLEDRAGQFAADQLVDRKDLPPA
jgi:hypothetical protein